MLRHLLLVACLLLAGGRSPLFGQSGVGTVTGLAVRDEDGAPVSFALVRLIPADQPAARPAPAAQGITTERGRFRFTNVSPGDYRVQVARIGFRPVLSDPLHLDVGATIEHRMRVPSQVLELATITVRGESDCLTGAELAQAPRVASLWAEAQKGVLIRRAFDQQYRYARVLRQDIELQPRFRETKREVRVDTVVSEPDSVRARERRLPGTRAAKGYATGNLIELPDERELLDDAFLQGHCLETDVVEADGALGLRFRPVQGRRDGVDIRGTIWVAADSYQIRRYEVEYVDAGDDDPFARSRVDYADVAIGGSALRMRTTGDGAILRVRGPMRVTVKRATATFTFTYQNLQHTGAQ